MATIKFLPRGTKQVRNVYLKLSFGRGNEYSRKTGYVIGKGKKLPMPGAKSLTADMKNLQVDLLNLQSYVLQCFNKAVNDKTSIDGEWLQNIIDAYHGKEQVDESKYLVGYFQRYIDQLGLKPRRNGEVGMSEATVKKCRTVCQKIFDFEEYKNKRFLISDVDKAFADEFISFLKNVQRLGLNTVGTYVKYLKTICNDAKANGFDVHFQVGTIKGFKERSYKIVLSQKEIDLIEDIELDVDYLDNARNWLVLGCNIGQRVSDLLNLDANNIVDNRGVLMIELIQKKTKKKVAIPINNQAQRILDKNNGNFPRRISDVKFNEYIKKVCKEAGIAEEVEGAKMDKETKRKKKDIYAKYELVTSHICRRSFATNYYGVIPTALLKDITAHSTEKQFLEYVGKPATDSAHQVAKYMLALSNNEGGIDG